MSIEKEVKKFFKFFSRVPSIRTHTPSGRVIHFINGECITDNEEEIAHLAQMVDDNHPIIYSKPEELLVTDPMEGYAERIRSEYLKELEAQGKVIAEGKADMGKSEPQKLTPTNTQTINAGASGSASGQPAPAGPAASK